MAPAGRGSWMRMAASVGWSLAFQVTACGILSLRVAQVATGPAAVPGDRAQWLLPLAGYVLGTLWMAVLAWALVLRQPWVRLGHAFTFLALAAGGVQLLVPGLGLTWTLVAQCACFLGALPLLGSSGRLWTAPGAAWETGEAVVVQRG